MNRHWPQTSRSNPTCRRADGQAIAVDWANIKADRSTLSSDKAKKTRNCAGKGASSQACSQDAQQVSQDRTQLTQAIQQVVPAKLSATNDLDQNQAKVASDKTKLGDDQAYLVSLRATTVNPGTTYTFLPQVGDVIKEDQNVYSLNNEPVPLLYGSIAAYRAFYVGMSDGADVNELTHDLMALGCGAGLTGTNHYSSATAMAVERWQRSLDLPVDGRDTARRGCVRARSNPGHVGRTNGGASVGGGGGGDGGIVLTATATTPIVTVDLDVTQEYLVKPGDTVSIVLPDGTSTVGGRIETVGSVATCAGGGGIGTGSGTSGHVALLGGREQQQLHPDCHGDHHLGQHPAAGHLGPGAGERQHHDPTGRQRPGCAGERSFGPRGRWVRRGRGDRRNHASGRCHHRPLQQHLGPNKRVGHRRRHPGRDTVVVTTTVPVPLDEAAPPGRS